MIFLAAPLLISLISNAYVPLYAMYKAAENSYQSGYGRSDYDDYYDDDGYGYDRSGYVNSRVYNDSDHPATRMLQLFDHCLEMTLNHGVKLIIYFE